MTYFTFVLLFISYFSFACSSKGQSEELKAFITKENFAETVQVAVYYPLKVEGGTAGYARVSIVDENDNTAFSTQTEIIQFKELAQKNELSGYAYSHVNVRADLIDKLLLRVSYHLPRSANGAIAMCSPTKFYDIGKLPEKELQ